MNKTVNVPVMLEDRIIPVDGDHLTLGKVERVQKDSASSFSITNHCV
ncbi:hypothetical protein [Aneurinibacillus aneurinilyticus]|nr:hypothetical protein [Aneurinibacillus aneurinilyticus]